MTDKFKYIDVEKLSLDASNPRLPKSMHNSQDSDIITYMLREESTLELMQAIAENGFFEGEQLLVVPIGKDKYKVVEGNRRLTSVKLLNNYTLATVKKELVKQIVEGATSKLPIGKLPCLEFEKEEEIRKYLGFRHVTGIKAWGHSEKARYLYELYKSDFSSRLFTEACYEIAKTIGSTKSYIERVLTAYQIYLYIEDENYFEIPGLNDTNFFVGYYSDGISRSNIAKFLGVDWQSDEPLKNLNKENVELLTKWFYEKFELDGKIQTRLKGKSGDLDDLNKILGHERAKDGFINQDFTLAKAIDLAEDIDSIFQNSLRTALLNLENADRITQNLDHFYAGLEDDLIQIRKLTTKIKAAKDNFEKDEDEFK
jgi:hypothetical protein